MCIAILQKPGFSLTQLQLNKGWATNSDGGGFAYLDNDKKVQINTGYLDLDTFSKKYFELVERFGKNGPMLVHMRIRSAGGLGRKNCHPFRIKNGAMIHNGTMFYPSYDKDTPEKEKKSDTRILAESFHNILDLESVKKAEDGILKAIGHHNKLAFLYDGGEYHIVNENHAGGHWDAGIWYSNSSCKVYNQSSK